MKSLVECVWIWTVDSGRFRGRLSFGAQADISACFGMGSRMWTISRGGEPHIPGLCSADPAAVGMGSSEPGHRPGAELIAPCGCGLISNWLTQALGPSARLCYVPHDCLLFSSSLWFWALGGFGARAQKDWLCWSQSSSAHSVPVVKRPWVPNNLFFFFNLKRFWCAVKLIKPYTALSINFMVYEFSILWTRNPSAEDLCPILGNPAATALQILYY